MTDKFAALRKLNGDRMPGEWYARSAGVWTKEGNQEIFDDYGTCCSEDREFICAAANMMDALLSELDKMRDVIEAGAKCIGAGKLTLGPKQYYDYCDALAAWRELTNADK